MRSVMVTGASRGIGLEFVRQHLADGWQVYATCRKAVGAEQLKTLESNGRGQIHILEMDVTDAAQVKVVAERLKGKPIDVLINNASTVEPIFYGGRGAYEGTDDPDLRNYDFDAWLEVLRTNVLGPARVCGAFVDNLTAGERPVAVNISSTLASIASTWLAGRYAYRTSKAALNMLTRSIGEWYAKRGIILVSISPGWTRTEMGGPKATNSAEDSVKGVRNVIAGLTMAETGKFFNFNGQPMPW
jgi:NAD(P)-dependent dehydrogenase (short-subunit alcohol dehydrogenase family)